MYNGEKELFDLRYNILKDYIDEFIVVEAPTTFSGRNKPLYFSKNKHRFSPKVSYFVIDENYSHAELKQADESPNTIGAGHWKHEFLQKESIKKALKYLHKNDVLFIGDCDEIYDFPKVETGLRLSVCPPHKLKLNVYTYYLNNHSSEDFWGTLVCRYGDVKDKCLNHLRTNAMKSANDYGWHFTSMAKDLKQKLKDSYTEESYATPEVMSNLQNNIENNRDFLGRNFTYKVDEEWPKYLTDNREKYKHLCK